MNVTVPFVKVTLASSLLHPLVASTLPTTSFAHLPPSVATPGAPGKFSAAPAAVADAINSIEVTESSNILI
jgi:hypothetical protein